MFVTCACCCLVMCLVSASFAGAKPSDSTATSSTHVSAKSVAHYIMGVSHDLLEDIPSAIREYEKATEADPGIIDIRARLASLYLSVGSVDAAIYQLKEVLRALPDDRDARYLLATAYISSGKHEEAFKEYDTIFKALSPSVLATGDFYFLLGRIYYSVGAVDKAILQFEKVLELKPNDTDMAYLLGGYYAAGGKNARAVPFFQQCIAADPFHDACLNGLGYTYAEEGRNLDEAESLIKRALESDPKNPAYLDSLGWVYYQKGLYVEALRELSAAVDLLDDPAIYEHLGEVYAKLGERSLAEAQWLKSLALDPDQPALRARLNNEKKAQDVPVGKTK